MLTGEPETLLKETASLKNINSRTGKEKYQKATQLASVNRLDKGEGSNYELEMTQCLLLVFNFMFISTTVFIISNIMVLISL